MCLSLCTKRAIVAKQPKYTARGHPVGQIKESLNSTQKNKGVFG